MKSIHAYRKNLQKRIYMLTKEQQFLIFFVLLLASVILRIGYLQLYKGAEYTKELYDQHYSKSTLEAKRGNIYVLDKSGKKMKLTENITLYNLFVDPNFIPDKARFISDFTPLLYTHFCEQAGMQVPTELKCINSISEFSSKDLLPKKNIMFYGGPQENNLLESDLALTGATQFEIDQLYQEKVAQILSWFTKEQAYTLIQTTLDEKIYVGMKKRNYLWTIPKDKAYMFTGSDFDFITVDGDGSVFVDPARINNPKQVKERLALLSIQENLNRSSYTIQRASTPQRLNYVKLTQGMHPTLAGQIRMLKQQGLKEKIYMPASPYTPRGSPKIPLYHGIWLEEIQQRYYPFWGFLSHVLGYVDEQGKGRYGVEEYYQSLLEGKAGTIIGLAASRIGQVGSNELDVIDPQDGKDIILTIDPVIQKEVEQLTLAATTEFNSDGIAVTIIDPQQGTVKAMVSTPTFNPNTYKNVLAIKPVTLQERGYIDDDSRYEYPMFFLSGWVLQAATSKQRDDMTLQKYMFKNGFWFLSYINKNIAFPYEPWSIFKPITLGIGIDSNAISLYDYYNDPGQVKVGDDTIENVMNACRGNHTFSHALAFSCNVGMVRIAQQMTKYVFYNYLERLWFQETTGIELAGEESSTMPDVNSTSVVWFFNNTFGQGLLTTPLQMASVFSALVNGGMYIQPTVIQALGDKETDILTPNTKQIKTKIFTAETSESLKDALIEVVRYGSIDKIKYPWFGIWAKSGTSEIAYKGKYRWSIGRTNGSAMGMITRDTTKYIIAIQVRRPRSSKWGNDTAVKLLNRITGFLLQYDYIER